MGTRKMVPNGQKWSQMVPKGPNLCQMVPNITKIGTNLLKCLAMDKCIISWIGLKSGSFRFRKNQRTPGRST